MTSPETAQGPSPPTANAPDFRSALFWYVAWQVVQTAAVAGVAFLSFLLSATYHPASVDRLLAQARPWETTADQAIMLVSVGLCIYIASRHALSIGQYLLLFLAGHFISGVICVPIYALAIASVLDDRVLWPEWVTVYATTVAIYAIGSGIVMYFCRRQMLTRASGAA
jgi:magnesium-transporting ATPase (P-type)